MSTIYGGLQSWLNQSCIDQYYLIDDAADAVMYSQKGYCKRKFFTGAMVKMVTDSVGAIPEPTRKDEEEELGNILEIVKEAFEGNDPLKNIERAHDRLHKLALETLVKCQCKVGKVEKPSSKTTAVPIKFKLGGT